MLEMVLVNCPDCNASLILLAKSYKTNCGGCGSELELKLLDEGEEDDKWNSK